MLELGVIDAAAVWRVLPRGARYDIVSDGNVISVSVTTYRTVTMQFEGGSDPGATSLTPEQMATFRGADGMNDPVNVAVLLTDDGQSSVEPVDFAPKIVRPVLINPVSATDPLLSEVSLFDCNINFVHHNGDTWAVAETDWQQFCWKVMAGTPWPQVRLNRGAHPGLCDSTIAKQAGLLAAPTSGSGALLGYLEGTGLVTLYDSYCVKYSQHGSVPANLIDSADWDVMGELPRSLLDSIHPEHALTFRDGILGGANIGVFVDVDKRVSADVFVDLLCYVLPFLPDTTIPYNASGGIISMKGVDGSWRYTSKCSVSDWPDAKAMYTSGTHIGTSSNA